METVSPSEARALGNKLTSIQQAELVLKQAYDIAQSARPLLQRVQTLGGPREAATNLLESATRAITRAGGALEDEGLTPKVRGMVGFALLNAKASMKNIAAVGSDSVGMWGVDWKELWNESAKAYGDIIRGITGATIGTVLESFGIPEEYKGLVTLGGLGLVTYLVFK